MHCGERGCSWLMKSIPVQDISGLVIKSFDVLLESNRILAQLAQLVRLVQLSQPHPLRWPEPASEQLKVSNALKLKQNASHFLAPSRENSGQL